MEVKIINNPEMPAFAALELQPEARVFAAFSFSSSSSPSKKQEFEDEDENDDEEDCLPPVSGQT